MGGEKIARNLKDALPTLFFWLRRERQRITFIVGQISGFSRFSFSYHSGIDGNDTDALLVGGHKIIMLRRRLSERPRNTAMTNSRAV